MKKKAIISVSFGSNDVESGKRNMDPLEDLYREEHSGLDVYRVITNDAVIEQAKQEGDPIYAVRECLARMVLDGVTHVYAQPAYILNGTEYDELKEMLYSHKADFVSVRCGKPLLTSHDDFEKTAKAIMEEFPEMAEDEALVLISHGSDHHGNTVYCALDYIIKDLGYANTHIGTFNAYPQIDTVIRHLKKDGIKKVNVAPFMFVAGTAAMEGVCGDAENSIASQLRAAGFEVVAHRKCLGEYAGVRKVFAEHLEKCFEE